MPVAVYLSVFPANRGVLRLGYNLGEMTRPGLSVFPANRGVLRPAWRGLGRRRTTGFQYSLRIVGFCDRELQTTESTSKHLSVFPANRGVLRQALILKIPARQDKAFSIPCESWGSATGCGSPSTRDWLLSFSIPCESWGSATNPGPISTLISEIHFQYSLRIVGFCDVHPVDSPAPEKSVFQYSLRIVGFCDLHLSFLPSRLIFLSVFPANRGVLRRR